MIFRHLKERILLLSTSEISDAMDYLGISSSALSNIKPLHYSMKAFGVAYTVQYESNDSQHIQKAGDYIDDVSEENIIIIDNHGKTNCTVWGGLLTHFACKKNIQGTVINGVCRDVEDILKLKYPLFSLGYNMVTGKGRGHLSSTNKDINISGVLIKSNYYVYGDANGVLIIPNDSILAILDIAEEINKIEGNIYNSIKDGVFTLKEARIKFNYNKYGKGK